MTIVRLSLAALLGTVLGAGAATGTGRPVSASIAPTATAVVVERPAACGTPPGAESPLPAATRRLVAAGAQLTVVCGPADATAAVIRAAAGHDVVLGAGPDVRAALALAAADHPEVRFGPLA